MRNFYIIDDIDLWKLLLVRRPNDIRLGLRDVRGRNTQALDDFIKIVRDLNLVGAAEKRGIQI